MPERREDGTELSILKQEVGVGPAKVIPGDKDIHDNRKHITDPPLHHPIQIMGNSRNIQ